MESENIKKNFVHKWYIAKPNVSLTSIFQKLSIEDSKSFQNNNK